MWVKVCHFKFSRRVLGENYSFEHRKIESVWKWLSLVIFWVTVGFKGLNRLQIFSSKFLICQLPSNISPSVHSKDAPSGSRENHRFSGGLTRKYIMPTKSTVITTPFETFSRTQFSMKLFAINTTTGNAQNLCKTQHSIFELHCDLLKS